MCIIILKKVCSFKDESILNLIVLKETCITCNASLIQKFLTVWSQIKEFLGRNEDFKNNSCSFLFFARKTFPIISNSFVTKKKTFRKLMRKRSR